MKYKNSKLFVIVMFIFILLMAVLEILLIIKTVK